MSKKRKNRGRSKGSKGRGDLVQCDGCGKLVPEDKAKKITGTASWIEPRLAEELRKQGAYLPIGRYIKRYCISCAVRRGVSAPRAREERKDGD